MNLIDLKFRVFQKGRGYLSRGKALESLFSLFNKDLIFEFFTGITATGEAGEVDIYQGDIVLIENIGKFRIDAEIYPFLRFMLNRVGIPDFHTFQNRLYIYELYKHNFELLGNVNENPELAEHVCKIPISKDK